MMITKKLRVTITKEIEISIPDSYASEQNIADWRSGLWDIDGVDDIFKHAAQMAATGYAGYSLDGLGRLQSKGTTVAEPESTTVFDEIDYDVEIEIIQE
jgi:hypothetical protein